MSDPEDTTAPTVNVTIKRIEVVHDDPDRFIHSLNKAMARELAAPASSTLGWGTRPAPQRIVGLFYVPWRKRIRKAAVIVVGAGVIVLSVIGALSLL